MYVTNTDNDVFLDDSCKQFYVLLSGRWFRSGSMEGPGVMRARIYPLISRGFRKIRPKADELLAMPFRANVVVSVGLPKCWRQIPTTVVIGQG